MSFRNEFEGFNDNETRLLRYMLEQDGMAFFRYFFHFREGSKLKLNWHLFVIDYVLQAVIDQKITRLIINVAPGYTKTEQCVINFINRGLALNPRSKFIHASYSGDLAKVNSAKIKDTIASEEFQRLWPMELRTDSKAKGYWFNTQGGGLMAAPAGGQITGFRAGRMSEEFNGCFVIDDPVKPDDGYSKTKREAVNNRFNNTIRSRLALEQTPMVIVMQRIHEEDLTGYLLNGGSGDVWHNLTIPTLFNSSNIEPKIKSENHKPISINGVLKALTTGEPYAF